MIPPRDNRPAFAAAMGRVKEGMTRQQVRAILGEPDHVCATARYEPRLGAYSPNATWTVLWGANGFWEEDRREFWLYGCDADDARRLPTLGVVRFFLGSDGRVDQRRGQVRRQDEVDDQDLLPVVVAPGLVPEREIRRLIRLLATPQLEWYRDGAPFELFHPIPFLRAVNALQRLGKERAIAVLLEFLRVSERFSTAFQAIRVLIDVPYPPGYLEPVCWRDLTVGAINPPEEPTRIPRYPLLLVDDVPFLIGHDYASLARDHWPAVAHRSFWDELRREGRFRAHPLRPPDSLATVLPRLYRSPQWLWGNQGVAQQLRQVNQKKERFDYERYHRHLIVEFQWLRLAQTVCPVTVPSSVSARMMESYQHFEAVAQEIRRIPTRWDERRECYVRRDGSFDELQPHPPRTCTLQVVDLKVEIEYERFLIHRAWAEASFLSPEKVSARFQVYSARKGASPLATEALTTAEPDHVGMRRAAGYLSFRLPADGRVRFVVEHRGERVQSPIVRL